MGEIDEIHQPERHGEAAGKDEQEHAVGDASNRMVKSVVMTWA